MVLSQKLPFVGLFLFYMRRVSAKAGFGESSDLKLNPFRHQADSKMLSKYWPKFSEKLKHLWKMFTTVVLLLTTKEGVPDLNSTFLFTIIILWIDTRQ